ncbi:MAG: hypothetical protein J6S36_03440, partial [Eggerthellaceae bacterium]|nr:hypothetical protein [Eggerthellaceae bacterium]
LLQFGMLVCSKSSVVYPFGEVAPIATGGNARGTAAVAPKFAYDRNFAAARRARLQQICGCIPCRAGEVAFALKGTVPLYAQLPESHLTVNLVHGEGVGCTGCTV